MAKLQSGVGTEFEVDTEALPVGGGEDGEKNDGFNKEEVLQHLNYDCISVGVEGTGVDSEEVMLFLCSNDTQLHRCL